MAIQTMAKKSTKKPVAEGPQVTPDPWKEQGHLIRAFIERQPLFEKLCGEIAYSLEFEVRSAGIEVAAVTSRGKTLASFLEKLKRKQYGSPLDEITDIAGVRIVHLYQSDFSAIEKIIGEQFDVVEKVDKLAEQGDDRFGYGAIHFLVRLGDGFAGARYDELKTLVCEIQVRTALQDAWAIISHHLVYKRESTIPQPLRRRINSLSGLLETADDQFEHLRNARNAYISSLEHNAVTDGLMAQDANADSISVYLRHKFPGERLAIFSDQPEIVLGDFNYELYPTIGDIEDLFRRTKEASEEFFSRSVAPNSAFTRLAVALSLDDPGYRTDGWDWETVALFEECESLVEKKPEQS